MQDERNQPPESPTAIAMQTGMGAPGFEVRGPLEEALMTAQAEADGSVDSWGAGRRPAATGAAGLDVVPGQSGAEALADLPNARAEDPWDGP